MFRRKTARKGQTLKKNQEKIKKPRKINEKLTEKNYICFITSIGS